MNFEKAIIQIDIEKNNLKTEENKVFNEVDDMNSEDSLVNIMEQVKNDE
jgi:hypothetical protein